MVQFEKASKKKARLRCAIFGPSGAGKTFTALRMATGIGGRIALIDTEHRTASKYADRFEFDTCDLEQNDIVNYVEAIGQAAEYDVLIIDSMSHGWRALLEEVDRLASTKYRGNTWSAWSEGTPKQRGMVEALLSFPGHIIATMRSKTEWTTEQTDNGKSRPVRVGLAPDQGKGIEYEFDLLIEMTTEHVATIIKDRSGKFQDQIITKPDEKFGKDLAAWLDDGAEPSPVTNPPPENVTPPTSPVPSSVLNKRKLALAKSYGSDLCRQAKNSMFGDREITEDTLDAFAAFLAAVKAHGLEVCRTVSMELFQRQAFSVEEITQLREKLEQEKAA